MRQDLLTNQVLRKKFKNNFDLCNLAIQVGRNMILSGHEAKLSTVLQAVEDRIDEAANR